MNWFEAVILGIVQGLTEFLPVSSSGHLAIGQALFGVKEGNLSFDIIVHAATVLSTIVVFWKPICKLVSGLFKFKYNDETKYVCMILVSLIPVLIVGLFFKDKVEALFGSGLIVVGVALFVTAALLFLSERISDKKEGHEMDYKSAAWMGVAQAIAVIPGLSRSGATISAGLACGVKKEKVTQFSFLMVLIPVLGEMFLELLHGGFTAQAAQIGSLPLALGFLSAFVSGLFACKVMITVVRKAKLDWFAAYCVLAGIAALVLNYILK
ncbi:MAG: undecaprenyl-diphosphate phosphatase [Bacteroidales bacterium]|jgi:undecaprenyl-diphosphatase|nr:undecaprenyl-diphosphate phosphatase [Bacteroidales bacterium]MCI2121977.1 undecaprenyl-diphosphate phosphatase [Bacteroidales bacterium]MCI2146120.1 undecaprenyl-diphosphate phosphatase [Bacteroidales bacterium]